MTKFLNKIAVDNVPSSLKHSFFNVRRYFCYYQFHSHRHPSNLLASILFQLFYSFCRAVMCGRVIPFDNVCKSDGLDPCVCCEDVVYFYYVSLSSIFVLGNIFILPFRFCPRSFCILGYPYFLLPEIFL